MLRKGKEPVDKRKPKQLGPSASAEAKGDGPIDETSVMKIEMEIIVEVSKRNTDEPEVFSRQADGRPG